MTSFGRGRGWARSEEQDTILRRPGQPPVLEINTKFDNLKQLINSYNPNELHSDEVLNKIAVIICNELSSDSTSELWKMFNDLHNCALNDENFAAQYAKTIFNKSLVSQGNPILLDKYFVVRRCLLDILQHDYEARDEILKQSKSKSRVSMYLLAKCFTTLTVNSKPIQILYEPLIENMGILLNSLEEDDILMLVIMYLETQNYLHKKIDQLLVNIREVLLNLPVTVSVRVLLLFILDIDAYSRQDEFPQYLKKFYMTNLDKNNYLQKICSFAGALIDQYITTDKSTVNNASSHLHLTDLHLSDKKKEPDCEQLKNHKNDTTPTPRAILGSGAADK